MLSGSYQLSLIKRLSLTGTLFLALTLLFFFSAFGFQNFTADAHSYYASEILCSDSIDRSYCSPSPQADIRLFRGSSDEPKQIQDYGAEYFSKPFAMLLNRLLDKDDTLRTATVKIFFAKAGLSALLIIYSLGLTRRFPWLKHLAIHLAICFFCLPYSLFALAGYYPASISSLGIFAGVLTLRAYFENPKVSRGDDVYLLTALSLLTLLITTTRFETSVMFSIMVFLVPITIVSSQSLTLRRKRFASVVVVCLLAGGPALALSPIARGTLSQFAAGTAKILPRDVADRSVVVAKIGDVGFSVLAPVTLIDNSSRNIGEQFANEAQEQLSTKTNSSLALTIDYGIRFLAWTPLFIIFGIYGLTLWRNIRAKSQSSKGAAMVALVFLFLFFFVPYVARTPWFFWYVLPLFICILASHGYNQRFPRLRRVASGTVLLVNLASLVTTNYLLGDLIIANFVLSPLTQSLLAISLIIVSLLGIHQLTQRVS